MRKVILALTLIFTPMLAIAGVPKLTMINHFNQPLKFIVGINPDVLPDVADTFIVAQNESVSSQVLDLYKEAYIRVEDDNGDSAFWGIEIQNANLQIYGYLSHGIAFSWDKEKITFCTPNEYKQKGSC